LSFIEASIRVPKLIIRGYQPCPQVAILIDEFDASRLLSRMRAIDPHAQERNNSLA
jgi:hypothetical protein